MTAMSSRRYFETSSMGPHAKISGTAISLAAFILGAALLIAGIYTNTALPAIIGFVPFASALLYWNAMFWSKMAGDRMSEKSYRDYPY